MKIEFVHRPTRCKSVIQARANDLCTHAEPEPSGSVAYRLWVLAAEAGVSQQRARNRTRSRRHVLASRPSEPCARIRGDSRAGVLHIRSRLLRERCPRCTRISERRYGANQSRCYKSDEKPPHPISFPPHRRDSRA
jgi:NMD protein affecting ribosome stability and mRNA decay